MKKLVITSSALIMSLSLVGCNTMNTSSQYANSTIGTGVKYSATTIGTGVGYVANTGAFVGRGVGTVVGTGVGVVGSGVGLVTGKPVNYRYVNTSSNKVIYHNGHRYVVQNGRYVLIR